MALTAYDDSTDWSLDPSIGELVFSSYSWDKDFVVTESILESHVCSLDELSIAEGNGKVADDSEERGQFFPTISLNLRFVKTYAEKFLCVLPKDLYVYGSYNTEEA